MAISGATAPAQALRGRGAMGRRRKGSDARVRASNDRREAREPHPGSPEDAHRPQLSPTPTRGATASNCARRPLQASVSRSGKRACAPPPGTPSLSPSALGRGSGGDKAPRRRKEAPHPPRPDARTRRPPRPHPRQVTGKGKGPRPLP